MRVILACLLAMAFAHDEGASIEPILIDERWQYTISIPELNITSEEEYLAFAKKYMPTDDEAETMPLSELDLNWPDPEGLPRGWQPNADVNQNGNWGNVRTLEVPGVFLRRVYYPEHLGRGGARHPIIFFHSGFLFSSIVYPGIIQRVVTHGFVVVADNRCIFNFLCNPRSMANNVGETVRWFMEFTRDERQPQGLNRVNLDVARIGFMGHSMGGGATINLLNDWARPDHPLREREPQFRVRGGVPIQPWNSPLIGGRTTKGVPCPMGMSGGTGDLLVPPLMYNRIFRESVDLKHLTVIQSGHFEPPFGGGRYTPLVTDFLYASLLGDIPRWYRYFPRGNTTTPLAEA